MVEYTSKVLYNILLEKHDQMMVHNNLIVETLHPDNTIAKLAVLTKNISDEEQVSAVKTFNELVWFINFFSKQNTKSKWNVNPQKEIPRSWTQVLFLGEPFQQIVSFRHMYFFDKWIFLNSIQKINS